MHIITQLRDKRYRGILFILGVLFMFSQISCEKEPAEPVNTDTVSPQIKYINEWIKEFMEVVYLWDEEIPENLNTGQEPDPEAFFDKMLYKSEDKWSYITSDFSALLADLEGVPLATGISPAFIRTPNDQIVLVVEFVYPGSPAAEVGLKRGDIILTIDGQFMNINNYFDLYSKNSYTAGLGYISGQEIVSNGISVDLISRVIQADPIVHHEIIDIPGKKTGYLMYGSFTSGVNDIYIESLNSVFGEFKAAGITDLIVDLRYNRGGEVSVAAYLASAIAPAAVVVDRKVLVRYQFNKNLENYYKGMEGNESPNLVVKFPQNSYNLNLNKVYFLTGWKSASASELILIGLEPYMDVVVIGENTYGKYTGSSVFTDSANPPKHDWAMMPIILKYANSSGFTDFKDGIVPDYPIEELIFDLKPFGDPGDPLLAKAKDLIGGITAITAKKAASAIPFVKLEDKSMKEKSILIVNDDWKKGK